VGSIVGGLLGLGFMLTGLEIVYYYGPNVEDQKWSWITPGSLLGVVIFLAVSFAFSQYLRFSNSYNATYGSIGGIIILMLWLYYLGVAILAGGEVNAIIALAALKRGNREAPKYGSEEETDHPHTKSTAKAKPDDKKNSDGTKNTAATATKEGGSKPALIPYYAFDETRLSRQTQKRVATRRIARRERYAQHGATQVTGWAILKRPVSAIVYLGSIGYFLFAAITKRVQPNDVGDGKREDAHASQTPRPEQAARSQAAATNGRRSIPKETRSPAYADRV
jgi:hypothetical protein